jgi:hypothetical protein
LLTFSLIASTASTSRACFLEFKWAFSSNPLPAGLRLTLAQRHRQTMRGATNIKVFLAEKCQYATKRHCCVCLKYPIYL